MQGSSCEVSCPLCLSDSAERFHQDNTKRSQREYWRCNQCALVFVPPTFFLNCDAEKAEYELHENALADDGYRRFLNRFWQPFQEVIPECSDLLEFGCGPGPLLRDMMSEAGHRVVCFDPFFANDPSVLKAQAYDGVTATEVFEHLHDPKGVLEACLSYLKPNGSLGVMTKLVTTQEAFAKWHYKNDLTHVVFFSEATYRWIATRYDLEWRQLAVDVAVFSKAAEGS